ncbi:MAG: hypothetical protein FWD25_05495 [Clostridia bacterium]|nr:hypothetical protein [Clostridia bacterium]
MAKKLRKMLGDVNALSVRTLIQLIDTQSKATICRWCMDYAEKNVLPIFEKHCPGDNRPRNAIDAARGYLAGEVKFPIVKNIILNECHAAARELSDNPTAQAAARAVGQGSSVVHTLSHSLGLYFYAAATIAYDRIGLAADAQAYDTIAQEICLDYTNALRAIAVKDEPHPAKIRWHC